MKLPRDVDGADLAHTLERLGYQTIRQTGSHLRLASTVKGKEHHVTVPIHSPIKVGTLDRILNDVDSYLGIDRTALVDRLFIERR